MNTTVLASRLGMTPKALRRTLRKNFSYMRPDTGVWEFTEKDFEYIKDALAPQPKEWELTERTELNTTPPLPVETMRTYWSDPAVRATHKTLYADRRAKLLDRLKALQNA